MSDQQTERAPLLPAHRRDIATDPASQPGWRGRLNAMRIATTASAVTGSLTLILLITSMIIMSGRPANYYPPYDLFYTFASVAGFSILAILHSTTILATMEDGVPRSSGGVTGVLVDVFAGTYFLFQSLYCMQQFTQRSTFGCRYGDQDCETWRARAEPVFWVYLAIMLTFGVAHVVLLFLRTSLWRCPRQELRVRLVGEDGSHIRHLSDSGT